MAVVDPSHLRSTSRISTYDILNTRNKNLDSSRFAYKLAGDGQYGLDVVGEADPEVNESEMSIVIPFADGHRRDGVGDLLEVGGIDTSRHKRNPVILFDHGKAVTLPIGLAEDPKTSAYTVTIDTVSKEAKVKAFIYQGRGLTQVDKGQEYDHAVFCEQTFDLWSKKFIRSGSIGYQVVHATQLPPDYERGTPQGLHLHSTLMLEASAVVMPANQDTVRKMLAMPTICGKKISPYLVKSLTAYDVPETKTVVGFSDVVEQKACPKPETTTQETQQLLDELARRFDELRDKKKEDEEKKEQEGKKSTPIPHGDLSKTKIPGPKMKPGHVQIVKGKQFKNIKPSRLRYYKRYKKIVGDLNWLKEEEQEMEHKKSLSLKYHKKAGVEQESTAQWQSHPNSKEPNAVCYSCEKRKPRSQMGMTPKGHLCTSCYARQHDRKHIKKHPGQQPYQRTASHDEIKVPSSLKVVKQGPGYVIAKHIKTGELFLKGSWDNDWNNVDSVENALDLVKFHSQNKKGMKKFGQSRDNQVELAEEAPKKRKVPLLTNISGDVHHGKKVVKEKQKVEDFCGLGQHENIKPFKKKAFAKANQPQPKFRANACVAVSDNPYHEIQICPDNDGTWRVVKWDDDQEMWVTTKRGLRNKKVAMEAADDLLTGLAFSNETFERQPSTSGNSPNSHDATVRGGRRGGPKHLHQKSLRQKYRVNPKGFRRRIKRSSPGTTIVFAHAKDIDAFRKEAESMGLEFHHLGKFDRGHKVKLRGHDPHADRLACKYGLRMRRKNLPFGRTKDDADVQKIPNHDKIGIRNVRQSANGESPKTAIPLEAGKFQRTFGTDESNGFSLNGPSNGKATVYVGFDGPKNKAAIDSFVEEKVKEKLVGDETITEDDKIVITSSKYTFYYEQGRVASQTRYGVKIDVAIKLPSKKTPPKTQPQSPKPRAADIYRQMNQ